MSTPDEQRIGTLVADKFRLEHLIDQRTSCALFLATDGWTGARNLLLIVRSHFTRDQDAVRLLLDDARAASSIGHPNIASISELGFDADGGVFMALEPMQGETLAGLLGRVGGAIGPQHGVDLLLPVVGAMGAAHTQGLVHGDIRPDNVFLTYDAAGHPTAKLFGFGLARVQDAAARQAGPGQIAGNPYYMAPEEARGEPAGAASDVWAMGVVLYQSISGRLPFDAQDPESMLRAVTSSAARPLAAVVPQTSPAVAQAIDRALIADRAVRYSDMTQIHGALAAAVAPPPRPASTPPPAATVQDPLASTVAAEPPSRPVSLPQVLGLVGQPAAPAPPVPLPPASSAMSTPMPATAPPATPSLPHAAPPPRPASSPAPNPQGMARTMEMTPQEAEMLRGLQSQAMGLSASPSQRPPSVRPPAGPIQAAPVVPASAWAPASVDNPPGPPMPVVAAPPARKSSLGLVLGLLAVFVVLGGVAGVAAWWFVVRDQNDNGEETVSDAGAPTPTAPTPPPAPPATASSGVVEADAAGVAPPSEAPDAGTLEAGDAGGAGEPVPPPEEPADAGRAGEPDEPAEAQDAGPAAGPEAPEPDEPATPGRPTKRSRRRPGGLIIRRNW